MNHLSYSDAPHNWAICFQDECPLAATCLRHAVALLAPDGLTHHLTVLPAAREAEACRLYVEARPVVVARGMTHIFDDVRPADVPALRERVMGVFGCRAHYYRYRSGRYDITPGQQERLAVLFRHFGYTQQLHFDHTTEQYFFPKP